MSFDPPTSNDSQAYDSAQDADRVELIGGAVVSGTVDQGAGGLSAWLVQINGVPHVIVDSGSVAVSNLPVTQPVSGTVTATGPLTDAQLRATAVPVSGAVSVSNLPATQPVSGTVAVSAVSGTVTVDGSGHTQPVSGSVSVSNFPATQPVSGTVTASGPLTDTQLRATAVPVSIAAGAAVIGHVIVDSGSVSVSNVPHVIVDSGTFAALTDGTQRVGGTVTVDGSGVTQPVSGTFFQATQPVSVASLPLPAGAALDTTAQGVESAVKELAFDAWLRFDETRWS